MSIVTLLSGITFLVLGAVIWKFKLVDILAGYKYNPSVNINRLATMVGLSCCVLGLSLIVEGLLIHNGVIASHKAVLVVIGTIIAGTMVVGIVASYFSKR